MELFAGSGRVGDERGDVDGLARRRKRAQTRDSLFQKNRRAVKVAAAPVVEADPDLQDPVIQMTNRRSRGPPQELERLVLLEELATVELLDPAEKRLRWGVGAAGASGLIWCAGRLPLGRSRRFARPATGLGRARIR